jgi:hypothetical protein
VILPQRLLLDAMQSKWASILDPFLQLPLLQGATLEGVKLTTGANVLNHKLGRLPQGWIITDKDSVAIVYRSSPFNPLTLTLNSSGNCTVNIYVY